jgi:hypothetical protein
MLQVAAGKASVGGVAVAGRVAVVRVLAVLVHREVTVVLEQPELVPPMLAVEVEVSVVMALLAQETTAVRVELVLCTLL